MCYDGRTMKIRVLGAFGGEAPGRRSTAFLVNDRVLVDGGSVSGSLSVEEQLGIEHALLSHGHLDHVAGLAYLTETLACCSRPHPVTLTSIEPVIGALRSSVFNNVLWPDFSTLPPKAPVVQFRTLAEGAEHRVGELHVTPIGVSHTVPTAGFIVHDGSTGFIYSGDTGPTDALWQAARGMRGLRAVILECAFPNRLGRLAEFAKHMTPELIRRELDKLPPDVPVWIFHIKPQFYEETIAELQRMAGDRILILQQDQTYSV